jgi:hypothetical protein
MRPPRVVGPHRVVFGLVHARMTVLHLRSRCAPCARFQGEDTYMPAGNVSGDIRRVVEHVHVPGLHNRLS